MLECDFRRSFAPLLTMFCRDSQGRRRIWKSGGASFKWVGIICPTVEIRLTDMPKSGGAMAPPRRHPRGRHPCSKMHSSASSYFALHISRLACNRCWSNIQSYCRDIGTGQYRYILSAFWNKTQQVFLCMLCLLDFLYHPSFFDSLPKCRASLAMPILSLWELSKNLW